ncbi:sensor domain-containing diguanylate cyclase [Alkalibacter mobilis]|uniref:sensor domain-containing diguanylate cyclase n=1 Tax=Alkalibacter mobilis TaxID=2787712 RepID=UPI00189D8846|nr:sensor domain-containing diguanylate cyclase [Alkalibacter mobilis]MBF7097430.1 GGDEF domain-containing protein [Alkalibacter mobilis]
MDKQKFIHEDVYKFIFENSSDAIMLTTPDGKVYRANPAACEMFGRSEDEIISGGRDILVDSSDTRLKKALKERIQNGSVNAELTFLKKDGSKFPGQVSSNIFKDDEGNIWTTMIIRDITGLKKAEEAMLKLHEETAQMAKSDYLTGILNRRGFIEKLYEEMERVKRNPGNICLVMIDIDYFKNINDQYGHLVGDAILKNFSGLLVNFTRPYDIVGRYGGDEFILLLPDTSYDEALMVADRIRVITEEQEMIIESRRVKFTVSIGIAHFDHEADLTLDELISQVDDNMYRAKKKRNCVYKYE